MTLPTLAWSIIPMLDQSYFRRSPVGPNIEASSPCASTETCLIACPFYDHTILRTSTSHVLIHPAVSDIYRGVRIYVEIALAVDAIRLHTLNFRRIASRALTFPNLEALPRSSTKSSIQHLNFQAIPTSFGVSPYLSSEILPRSPLLSCYHNNVLPSQIFTGDGIPGSKFPRQIRDCRNIVPCAASRYETVNFAELKACNISLGLPWGTNNGDCMLSCWNSSRP